MKKLTRSRKNSVILGVCGGFAEYFNIDPIMVRLIWGLSLIPFFFSSSIIYVVCSIIIPYGKPITYESNEDYDIIYEDDHGDNIGDNNSKLIGLLLVIIGLFFLAREFVPNFINVFRLWPVLLIIAGIYVIFNKRD